jgi:hypothetical protein
MGLIFSLVSMHHYSLSLPLSNPQLPMAANFGEVVYTQVYSKSSMPYTVGSAFLVAIQWYMAHLVWRKID